MPKKNKVRIECPYCGEATRIWVNDDRESSTYCEPEETESYEGCGKRFFFEVTFEPKVETYKMTKNVKETKCPSKSSLQP